MWITKVYLYVSRQREPRVVGHLFAPIPRQRFVEFLRQPARVFDQRIYDRLCIFASNLHQHYVACMTFDKGCDLAVAISEQ